MDFYKIRTKRTKEGVFVYPDFIVKNSKDLLVKGGSFHAVWDETTGMWSRDEMLIARIIDAELETVAKESEATPMLMTNFETKMWSNWKNYVSSLDDSTKDLDTSLTFADAPADKNLMASRKLPYSLVDGPCPAWDELVNTLYLPSEREKIEYLIGSIITGDSKKNQKFFVFYGQSGKGKSTILNVMEQLFEGYYIPIDMKALGATNNSFAMAGFKNNPLLALQHDGDLSKIEDNTKLNSLVSHEMMPINEKFRSEYYTRVLALLVLGTNEPVRITGSKSGIIRRLIDITPSGNLIDNRHYHALVNQISFELGQIASKCRDVYLDLGKNYYSNYKPTMMMYETDVFYNFVEHAYDQFFTQDGIALEQAWKLYKEFCEDTLIKHRLPRHQFRSELSNYFDKFEERTTVNGAQIRHYYSGFKIQRFIKVDETKPIPMSLDEKVSNLDEIYGAQPAQYATNSGVPKSKWDKVTTTLSDLDTTQLHYVMIPENHIVIDFDLKDSNGTKSREKNLEAASEWPKTYTEYSQGGAGVHLHYIYDGPGGVGELEPLHDIDIEVKTLTGRGSLRRKFSRGNNLPIATISSGLKLKEKPVQDSKTMGSEKAIRKLLIENMRKEHQPGTRPSIQFTKKILEEAYDSGLSYDVSDMRADIMSFAMDSTNHARECMNMVQDMKFMSEDFELKVEAKNNQLAFFDVEVFSNLFVVCWKFAGKENPVVKMVNPTAAEIDELLGLKLIGFNCRRYDNHIMYAAAMGYSVAQLYELSQRIINNDKSAMFAGAYDLSYTDIFDFSSVKQSLKKFEIDLGIHHMELGLSWDEPVPDDMIDLVVEYCANDVDATEATFEARRGDFVAREILSELSELSVNAPTQQHTARIIFGRDKKPQTKFLYTDLSEKFPGYVYDFGTSIYRGEVTGEGGYVYAEPGVHKNVALLDVASMHPTSIEELQAFGPYTEKFSEIKAARIAIKRGDFNRARLLMDGRLEPYLKDENLAKALSDALKIVINIVYGLTSAKFENAFRDPRNKDNIVAKRGALFMIDLKHAVQEQGFTVAHIKTDSIKIPNATPEIIQFVSEFGEKYGYDFEHEATYEDFVLFNDAVYIAKNTTESITQGKPEWEATGAQFQHPYVFKTLLSKEDIVFDDLCETRNVVKGSIYIVTENKRRFVGRIGRFVPMLPGAGGGALMRVNTLEDGTVKDYAVTGTKGHEWLEAETVQKLGLEDKVDYSFFENLVEKARQALQDVNYI